MVAEAPAHAALLREVWRLAPAPEAAALLARATAILGTDAGALDRRGEILQLCDALAGEGVLVQEMAVEIARELASR